MPKLLEYQGKRLLKEMGIPVPRGDVASTSQEALRIATEIGKPVAVKAQIGVTGRFKAGGIKFTDTPEEAEKAAAGLLGKDIKGARVTRVLVEERLDVERDRLCLQSPPGAEEASRRRQAGWFYGHLTG